MQTSKRTFTGSFVIAGLLSVLLPCVAWGQESAIEARKQFTGRQLFEHQWQPDPASLGTVAPLKRVNGDGLGPLHNGTSCAECHTNGGGSGVQHNITLITVDPRSRVLTDKKHGGERLLEVFPALLGPRGKMVFSTVVHNRSTRPGYSLIRDNLASYVPGGIDNTWFYPEQRKSSVIAAQPVVAGRHENVDFYLSQLNSPALYGVAAIDSIRVERIIALAERQSKKTNGKITGRFVGKFGWRGQVATLSEFITQACVNELGLTLGDAPRARRSRRAEIDTFSSSDSVDREVAQSDRGMMGRMSSFVTVTQAGDPADWKYVNTGRDMTFDEVMKLTRFVSSLPRPSEKPQADHSFDQVREGERLFGSVGCIDCHVADVRPVSGIFSDLLLHDMGAGLQSPLSAPVGMSTKVHLIRPVTFNERGPMASTAQSAYGSGDFDVRMPKPYPLDEPEQPQFPRGTAPESEVVYWDTLQREWRTPPLWGVADSAPYLHDGRAETLEEAVLWHGGEAAESRNRYYDLSRADKDRMLAFLSSLRAPELTENETK
ncbi:di-heme oxidoredictase family protein [Novipirellula maiorica]|uniref:di-heme oxidoredictase family protein n=1 Tax=Novipirellula maiorica TaxID=1265734 RepID=UPI00068F15C9|nr:di-heme oxidoredictase family protein [Rhodopirellula maiorica]